MKLQPTPDSARSSTAPRRGETATGGRPRWTSKYCTGIPRCPTRWARSSTTPKEFKTLDLEAVIDDLRALMTDSQDWWPADFGHYGALFIRMAWHSAGTYRIFDGRGGAGSRRAALRAAQQLARQREPRQGAPAAVADQAEVRPQDLVGRPDDPGRQRRARVDGLQDLRLRRRPRGHLGAGQELYWGPEGDSWLGRRALQRRARARRSPLGAVQMGLIYVNPEGPNGKPDPVASARDIRETFAPHGDGRRGDRGADRRRPHLRQDPRRGRPVATSGRSPKAAHSRSRASAGRASFDTGIGADTITGGLEVAWTHDADELGQQLLREPVRLRVGADEEPGRRAAVEAEGRAGAHGPDAFDPARGTRR